MITGAATTRRRLTPGILGNPVSLPQSEFIHRGSITHGRQVRVSRQGGWFSERGGLIRELSPSRSVMQGGWRSVSDPPKIPPPRVITRSRLTEVSVPLDTTHRAFYFMLFFWITCGEIDRKKFNWNFVWKWIKLLIEEKQYCSFKTTAILTEFKILNINIFIWC